MVSEYNRFVSQHIRSAKGANIKDKMRAVAAMWRARKGKGKGLQAPVGRGVMAMRKKRGSGAMPLYPGREGASGGRVSKQMRLAQMIHGLGANKKRGGATQGALAALLHGLDIKVQ